MTFSFNAKLQKSLDKGTFVAFGKNSDMDTNAHVLEMSFRQMMMMMMMMAMIAAIAGEVQSALHTCRSIASRALDQNDCNRSSQMQLNTKSTSNGQQKN